MIGAVVGTIIITVLLFLLGYILLYLRYRRNHLTSQWKTIYPRSTDPRCVPESRPGNGIYSECKHTPSVPLPPIPQDPPPPSPSSTTMSQFGIPLFYPLTHFLSSKTASNVPTFVAVGNANGSQSNAVLVDDMLNVHRR